MSTEHSLPTSLHYPPKATSVSAESSKNVKISLLKSN